MTKLKLKEVDLYEAVGWQKATHFVAYSCVPRTTAPLPNREAAIELFERSERDSERVLVYGYIIGASGHHENQILLTHRLLQVVKQLEGVTT